MNSGDVPDGSAAAGPAVNPWLIAISVMSATFMEVLDTSVANVSLPHIAGTMSASTDESTWVLTSYIVSNAIILPATGWLSGFFGRKRLLLICTIIFTCASMVCGAATSLEMLIVARVIQGIGGGVLQPTSQAVMMESFPPAKRGQAMALYAMGIIVAPIIGPTLGGWITDNYSWRWIFYINLPVGIVSLMMTQTFVTDPPYLRKIAAKKIDYVGFGLMALGLGTLQLVLDKGQQEDWFSSNLILYSAAIAALALGLFVWWELNADEPIVDLRVLSNRNFAIGTMMMIIVGAALYSTIAILPIFLQTLMNYPSMQSGMAVSPRGIGSMISMLIVGRLVGRIDSRALMAFGFTILGISVWMLCGINLEIDKSSVVWPNVISGLAMGFIFVPLTTTAISTLRMEQIGNATGIYSLMRNLGGGIGISVSTTMLARSAQVHQTALVAHLTPYDMAFRERFQALEGIFGSRMGEAAGAQAAYAAMYGAVVRQATLLAFVENLRILAAMLFLCIPLVFLFRKAGSKVTESQ